MPYITLLISNECPYCNKSVPLLRYYQMVNGGIAYKFPGDFIITNSDKKLYFIKAKGYCESCKKSYRADVGVSKSFLTKITKTYKNTKMIESK